VVLRQCDVKGEAGRLYPENIISEPVCCTCYRREKNPCQCFIPM